MYSEKVETREACLDSLWPSTSSRTLPKGTCEYNTSTLVWECCRVSSLQVIVSRLLVGAPRAKHQNQVNVTGVVYQCDLATTSERCKPIEFDNEGLFACLKFWAIYVCNVNPQQCSEASCWFTLHNSPSKYMLSTTDICGQCFFDINLYFIVSTAYIFKSIIKNYSYWF